MKVQILSNLWNRMPANFIAKAPTLILCGNVGQLCGMHSWNTLELVNTLSKGFKQVYWVPFVAETFTGHGTALTVQEQKDVVRKYTNATLLCNDVLALGDKTLVASSGWPEQFHHWSQEDAEFIRENAMVDTVLLSAGGLTGRATSRTLILGQPVAGFGNVSATLGRQRLFTNSAAHGGFCPSAQFEI